MVEELHHGHFKMIRYIFKARDFPNLHLSPERRLDVVKAIVELTAPAGYDVPKKDLDFAESLFGSILYSRVAEMVLGNNGAYKFSINNNGDVVGQWHV